MKKIFYLFIFFLFSGLAGKSQCGLDSSNMNIGFWPPDTTLSKIVQNVPYDTFIQLYVPAFLNDTTDTLQIVNTIITNVSGLPTGITYISTPPSMTMGPNARACWEITGVTTDTAGPYSLQLTGVVEVRSPRFVGGDTILTIQAFSAVAQAYYGATTPPYQYTFWVVPPYVRPCNNLSDTSQVNGVGVYPVASDLPCIVQNVPYDQTVAGRIQMDSTVTAVVTVNVTVDSIEIDSILGMPTGITFGVSPRILYGGAAGCVNFAGTTNDSLGTYPIQAWGTAWFTASAMGQTFPYTRRGNLNGLSSFGGYYLRVVSSPDSCTLTIPSGINDFNKKLNASISVYPNPSNGIFELRINAASPVTGQVLIYDAIGKQIYSQPVDVLGVYSTSIDLSKFGSGLYFIEIHTPQGSALRKVSVE